MTFETTWRRRLAQSALRHGRAMLPSERVSWADAMRAELQHIDDDGEALWWALGSLRAGYAERLRTLRRILLCNHSLSVVWIIMFIVSSAYNLSVALATRLRYQGVASALGSLMRGFHYDRFVALADAIPAGLFVLMACAVVLFAVSLWLSLRHEPAAFGAFCGAAGLSLGIWLYQLRIPAYVQTMSPQHLWRIGICFVLTAGVLSAARLGGAAQNPRARGGQGNRQ